MAGDHVKLLFPLSFLGVCLTLVSCGGDPALPKASVATEQTHVEPLPSEPPAIEGFTFLRAETFACGGQEHRVLIYQHDQTRLEFVLVPGGEFSMGSPEGESGRLDDEGPRRRVRIRPFLLCRTPVTQAAWKAAGGDDLSRFEGEDLPLERVSWEQAQEWCKQAGLRLPSEAEWEYACRAGTTTRYYFGDQIEALGNYAWFSGNSKGRTHPVGMKLPNAFGLFDMLGNVWEWVEDSHGDYRSAPSDGTARVAGSSRRVYRGGGWSINAGDCRCAVRGRNHSGRQDYYLGFRPAGPSL